MKDATIHAAIHRIGFIEGTIEAITLYAIWRNGEQLVGCMETPLKEVLKPYQEELMHLRDTLSKRSS